MLGQQTAGVVCGASTCAASTSSRSLLKRDVGTGTVMLATAFPDRARTSAATAHSSDLVSP